jgi:hypothetical protein
MGARQWQAAQPDSVYRWPTANTHYRTDVDSEEDRLAIEARTGLSLRWPADASPPTSTL